MRGEPSQEIFDVVRAGDTGRLQALLTADPSLANVRNARGHSPVLIAQYHHKNEAVAVLLAARPELDIFDAASVGDTAVDIASERSGRRALGVEQSERPPITYPQGEIDSSLQVEPDLRRSICSPTVSLRHR